MAIAVRRLLQAALELPQPVQLVCREGTHDHLLAALRLHEIDGAPMLLTLARAQDQASCRACDLRARQRDFPA